ncbi:MAG TPA: DUF2911 domain-containing protein [Terriglobales bacterium]|nr:DUF2911 domain-containing protein [Terriglobales bacterium]
MNRHHVLASLLGLVIAAAFCQAQSFVLDLPRSSQHALISQRVGITDITINYHRPLVNGRKVWGGLVPYGQVWRAGANENTTITFTDPVTIEGKPLDKGSYGLHMIPGESEWTVIFSKNSTSWGSFTYNQAEDALRVTVKPQATDLHEALTYDFAQVKPDSSVVTLAWERIAVPFTVGVNTKELVAENLHRQLRGLAQYSWDGWDDAAHYLLDSNVHLDEALQYEDKSIQNEERFENLVTKSLILDALGRKEDASTVRDKALAKAMPLQLHIYARQLQAQKKQDEAFAIFRSNYKKYPNEWFVHTGMARVYSAQGDFENAAKEMETALASAPDQQKSYVDGLVRRLQAKEDINK